MRAPTRMQPCDRAAPVRSSPRRLRLRFSRRLSTRCQRRNVARYAALPRVDAPALLEARQGAGNDGTGGCKSREPLAHFLERHARFLGDFEIKPLTILAQASENFDHDAPREMSFKGAAPRSRVDRRRANSAQRHPAYNSNTRRAAQRYVLPIGRSSRVHVMPGSGFVQSVRLSANLVHSAWSSTSSARRNSSRIAGDAHKTRSRSMVRISDIAPRTLRGRLENGCSHSALSWRRAKIRAPSRGPAGRRAQYALNSGRHAPSGKINRLASGARAGPPPKRV